MDESRSRAPAVAAPAPTLEDVARMAGVSRATVSRVVNRTRNVDPAIQETVRQAVAAVGYVPNSAARSLITRRTGSVALVVSGAGEGEEEAFRNQVFTDPFFSRVINGVLGFLRPRGMHPVLMLAETAEAREQVVSYLRQGNADGTLLVSTHAADPLPGLLVEAGLPAVLFARPARAIPIGFVDLAHQEGARLAADRLVAGGRRRVVAITGPLDIRAARDRQDGFIEAMARHGEPWIPLAAGNFTQASGEAAMRRLLAEHPDLDGVFAANDLMAQGALHILREHGRRVPEDVSVIGFDDSSAATASRPALTTVRQPVEEMAAEMARLLLERIAEPGGGPKSAIFDPVLVVRQSG
ncbi:DNA-binding LacI/PurR family transcriptional regulator [Streptacidiphilus sp. MAP12-16]|uniref:LacI family DNA-binding transcriptional regulator n=1 Tax=Streptacidiphilus sp. MAP12-16 TaxID=3156300 RepID=UPI00351495B8